MISFVHAMRTWFWVVIAAAVALSIWTMHSLGWLCGPSTCAGIGGWLYDFQNLIAGVLALLAGVGAYIAGRHQARATRQATEQQIAAEAAGKQEDNASIAANVFLACTSQLNAVRHAIERGDFDSFSGIGELGGSGLRGALEAARQTSHRCWNSMQTVPIPIGGDVIKGLLAFDSLITRADIARQTPQDALRGRSGDAIQISLLEHVEKVRKILNSATEHKGPVSAQIIGARNAAAPKEDKMTRPR